jgi:hypothetical protein
VIFENNSEPAAKNAKKTCGAGTSDHRADFNNREEQGGAFQRNSVLAVNKPERGKTGLLPAIPAAATCESRAGGPREGAARSGSMTMS